VTTVVTVVEGTDDSAGDVDLGIMIGQLAARVDELAARLPP